MSRSTGSTEVRPSLIHGLGLFAAQGFPSGAKIAAVEGHAIPMVEADLSDSIIIDGVVLRITNDLRRLNESDAPNAELRGLDLHALCDIAAGEEITIRYAPLSRLPNPTGDVV